MEPIQILELIFNFICLFTGVVLLRYTLKVRKENKNPIDLALFFLILALFFIRLNGLFSGILSIFGVDIQLFLGIDSLGLSDILYIIYGVILGWFVLFIYELKRLYSLPFVTGIFIEYYIVFTNDRTPQIFFITFIAVISSLVFLWNAIKNKNGSSFSIVLASMVIIPEFYLNFWWLSIMMTILVFWSFYLGISGWWDEKIFFDRNKRKMIQNTWIARTVR